MALDIRNYNRILNDRNQQHLNQLGRFGGEALRRRDVNRLREGATKYSSPEVNDSRNLLGRLRNQQPIEGDKRNMLSRITNGPLREKSGGQLNIVQYVNSLRSSGHHDEADRIEKGIANKLALSKRPERYGAVETGPHGGTSQPNLRTGERKQLTQPNRPKPQESEDELTRADLKAGTAMHNNLYPLDKDTNMRPDGSPPLQVFLQTDWIAIKNKRYKPQQKAQIKSDDRGVIQKTKDWWNEGGNANAGQQPPSKQPLTPQDVDEARGALRSGWTIDQIRMKAEQEYGRGAPEVQELLNQIAGQRYTGPRNMLAPTNFRRGGNRLAP